MGFQPLAVARHGKACNEINGGHKNLTFYEELAPVGIAQRQLDCACEVVQTHNGDQRSVLEGTNEGVHNGGHHQAQRLGQHNHALNLPVAKAQ